MNKNYFLLAVLLSSFAFSQNKWQTMMHDKSANFFDIQKDFNLYYKAVMKNSNKIPKGSGIKQFKRWEYYWESRVDAQGNFPPEGHVQDEIARYNASALTQISRTYDPGTGTWEIVGPVSSPNNGTGQMNGNGRVNCITFHPTDPNTIFVGAPSGGVWKSTDNGSTWTEFSGGLTRLGVSSIVIDPNTPSTIYIGTGDRDGGDAPGYGVWRSTDGGMTWQAHNTGMGNRTVYEILMDPTDSNILIASTNGGRIYRSTNAGANWSYTSVNSSSKDIAFHPTDSNVIYTAGTTVNKSTDNGQSFSPITSGVPTGAQRIALAVTPANPNYVYLLAGNGSGLMGIYRSTDSGLNYTTRTTSPNILGYETNGSGTASQAWYDLVIAADPTDAEVIYTGGVNLWKSVDGGTTMTCASYWVSPTGGIDGVHADQHALEFSPHNNNIYNGNDGGLYTSTDNGLNWDDISSGLAIAQIYKIGVSQTVSDLAINGYQDNGTSVSRGINFSTEIGGDGMECAIDPTDENYMYGAVYYGDISRSINNGSSFQKIAGEGFNGITEGGAWVTPYKLDPNNSARMFVGYKNIWRSNDVKTPAANAVSWTQISSFSGSSNIRDIAIAPSNSDVVYISRYDNKLYRSDNATAASPTWTDLGGSLPISNEPKDIEIDPTDPTHIFIAINNDIFESTDSGTSWTNVSGTLPNISLNTIVIDHTSTVDAMYVGMDVGVYYKDNTMSDWIAYNSGLANLEVTELEIQYATEVCENQLFGATYGQGLWKTDLRDPGNIAPVACFRAESTNGCLGNTFVINDFSAFAPTSWTWTITPATFNYVGGTTANSQNIEIEFTAIGTYTIELTATNATGTDVESKTSYITVGNAAVATLFNTDFESDGLCGTASDCGATVCNISGLWSNLTNGTDDDIDWRVDEGGTPSSGTGPTVDYNPGTATGNYIYLEASSCFSKTGILETSCVNLDTNYDFELGYFMSGASMGSLHIDLFSGGAWITDVITPISGDQGASWNTLSVDLSAYTGQSVKLRIRGITGTGYESDIALDDIMFKEQIPLSADDSILETAGVTVIPNPTQNYFNIINPQRLELKVALLYDLAGRLIQKTELSNSEESKAINISELESAIYVVHIKGKEGELVTKLIKE
ncbi:MAG: VPS10 domain-containing protein [Flavobacteriaceae bacterium]